LVIALEMLKNKQSAAINFHAAFVHIQGNGGKDGDVQGVDGNGDGDGVVGCTYMTRAIGREMEINKIHRSLQKLKYPTVT
jgi:hypothetical protein